MKITAREIEVLKLKCIKNIFIQECDDNFSYHDGFEDGFNEAVELICEKICDKNKECFCGSHYVKV
jgi:hypothetical protein